MPGADVLYILCAPAQIRVILARKGDMLPIVRPCYNPIIVGCHYHFLKKVDYTARHSPLIKRHPFRVPDLPRKKGLFLAFLFQIAERIIGVNTRFGSDDRTDCPCNNLNTGK